jgi:DNA-binding transcriptional LysR family regulator
LPLHRVLLDAQAIVRNRAVFDPRTAERTFVIAAPDFLSVLILPELMAAIAREAPGVTLEIVPSARRGNAWMLETGELDGVLASAYERAGFRDVVVEVVPAPLHLADAAACVRFERESFGALHQMLAGLDETGRDAAWDEITTSLREFEGPNAFVGPCEMVIAVGTK